MAQLQLLHERAFLGKQLDHLKVYDDPFGGKELCIELCFVDGEVACLSIGSGTPTLVSSGTYDALNTADATDRSLLVPQECGNPEVVTHSGFGFELPERTDHLPGLPVSTDRTAEMIR